MLRQSELPLLSDIPAFEDDPALFDPSPAWFVPGLKASHRDDEDDDYGLGLRSLIDQPDALSEAWRTTGIERDDSRGRRTKRHLRRRSSRSSRSSRAA